MKLEVLQSNELRKAQMVMLEILNEVDSICKNNNIEYFLIDGTLLGAVRHGGFIPWDDDLDVSMTRENFNKFEEACKKDLSKEFFMQTLESDPYYNINFIPMKVRKNGTLIIERYNDNDKCHNGIYIDVFPLDYVIEDKWLLKIQHLFKRICLLLKVPPIDYRSGYKVKYISRVILFNIGKLFPMKLLKKLLLLTNKWSCGQTSKKLMYGVDTMWDNQYNSNDIFPIGSIEFEGKIFPCPAKPHNILQTYYGDYMKLPPKGERFQHSIKIKTEV